MPPIPLPAADKPLNQMNRLTDMGHFPAAVNAGATANILLTLAVTWWVEPRFAAFAARQALPINGPELAPAPTDALNRLAALPLAEALLWTAFILLLNLAPVLLLRRTLTPTSVYPPLSRMNFFHDQHKFSDWVYLAASANMAFWLLTAWTLFSLHHTAGMLVLLLIIAAIATFSPVLRRAFL